MADAHELGYGVDLAVLVLFDKLVPVGGLFLFLPALVDALSLGDGDALGLTLQHDLALEGGNGRKDRHRQFAGRGGCIKILFERDDLHTFLAKVLDDIEQVLRATSQA